MIINLSSAQSTQEIWKQERVIVYADFFSGTSLSMWTDLHGSSSSPLATYSASSDEDFEIDITDYVRTYPSVSSFYFDDGVTQVTLAVDVVGLINPDSVIIPYSAMLTKIGGTGILCPPAKMFAPIGSLRTLAECCGYASGSVVYGNAGGTIGGENLTSRTLSIPNTTTIINYNSSAYVQTFLPLVCGEEYACVRWVSFTGQTRQHTMIVRKPTIASANNYSLLNLNNEYNEVKGRVDSFALVMENLCLYDLWYYADMITSSKVEVSIDGVNFLQVQVTTKNITLPDGQTGTNGKLEVNVNYRKYDAVAM